MNTRGGQDLKKKGGEGEEIRFLGSNNITNKYYLSAVYVIQTIYLRYLI